MAVVAVRRQRCAQAAEQTKLLPQRSRRGSAKGTVVMSSDTNFEEPQGLANAAWVSRKPLCRPEAHCRTFSPKPRRVMRLTSALSSV